jgi:uncharacterized Zn-finger protein
VTRHFFCAGMGSDQSRIVWSRVDTLMENEPEAPEVAYEDSDCVVLYDPSSMLETPRTKRKLWQASRDFNTSCKKRLLRITRGATLAQFEERQGDGAAALPFEKYNKAHETLISISCRTCFHIAGSPSELLIHERTHSGEKPYVCGQCGKCFAQNSHLRVHERVHNGEKPYPCEQCDKRFTTSGNLRLHTRIHSGEKPYLCGDCHKRFTTSGNLRDHKRIHSGEKPFECIVCDQTFGRSDHLRSHERTHSGEKPFECEQCGQTFTQSNHLLKHKRTHSGEKPFTCEQCGKIFSRGDALRAHERTHSGEKPFECVVCGHTFAQSGDLVKHQRTHSGEKPYRCEECGKTFARSGQLRTHERTHSGKKPFACRHCDRTFSQSGHRRGHERMHDRPSEFPCDFQDFLPVKYDGEGIPCGLNFPSAVSLGFHIRERHDKEHVFNMPAEMAVREALTQTFGEGMQHDWKNYLALGSCESVGSRSYRFDFRTPSPPGFEMLVVTEVDEFQHRRYACDLKRMLHAYQVLLLEFQDTPIVFVRWNPDPRKIGAVYFNVPFDERVKQLTRVLQNEAVFENGKKMSDLVREGLNVIYMYYDLERVDGELNSRVCMLNGVDGENMDNAATVRANVIATF